MLELSVSVESVSASYSFTVRWREEFTPQNGRLANNVLTILSLLSATLDFMLCWSFADIELLPLMVVLCPCKAGEGKGDCQRWLGRYRMQPIADITYRSSMRWSDNWFPQYFEQHIRPLVQCSCPSSTHSRHMLEDRLSHTRYPRYHTTSEESMSSTALGDSSILLRCCQLLQPLDKWAWFGSSWPGSRVCLARPNIGGLERHDSQCRYRWLWCRALQRMHPDPVVKKQKDAGMPKTRRLGKKRTACLWSDECSLSTILGVAWDRPL